MSAFSRRLNHSPVTSVYEVTSEMQEYPASSIAIRCRPTHEASPGFRPGGTASVKSVHLPADRLSGYWRGRKSQRFLLAANGPAPRVQALARPWSRAFVG